MADYLSSSRDSRQEMLKELGLADIYDLYKDVPADLILRDGLELPHGVSEQEVLRIMKKLAKQNKVYDSIFRGAGSYHHYIPAIVDQVAAKETFLTAYTPYQAEISQGILQNIFEYQTMICKLTGMDVSNASVYDGATAAAEAAAMCRDRKKNRILVSAAADPEVRRVIETYSWAAGGEVVMVPEKDRHTDLEALKEMLDGTAAAVYFQQPDFYGTIEDMDAIVEMAHAVKAKVIAGVNPIAAAILKTPGEAGCDICVGEGQPLGLPLGYGGPYLGFMAAKKDMMRKLPGRIVGQTADDQGRTAYVLTLQAREQHIRREKASSNICSNEALCALRAAVYLSAMGREGVKDAARQCLAKAHYLQQELAKIGYVRDGEGEFFHEFVTETPIPAAEVNHLLDEHGILGGLALDENHILRCATEMNTKESMDEVIHILKGACA